MLWPELGLWQLLALIFYYQQHKLKMINARRCLDNYAEKKVNGCTREEVESFVIRNEQRRIEYLENLIEQKRRSNIRSSGFKH